MIYFLTQKYQPFEDLSKTGNDKYEFIYPEAALEKNVFMSDN